MPFAVSLELSSQRVWDYVGDGYVHRLIQNLRDGKLVELPDPRASGVVGERSQVPPLTDAVESEMVLQKMERISYEYTLLLTSQLETQRDYYERLLVSHRLPLLTMMTTPIHVLLFGWVHTHAHARTHTNDISLDLL
jgi:hypothetical protein